MEKGLMMETRELIAWLNSCAEKNCPVCPEIEECVGPSWLLQKAAERLEEIIMDGMEHGWVAIDEYMPTMMMKKSQEEGGRDYLESDYVLVWDGTNVEIAQAVSDESGVYWLDRYAEVVNAVSWMPTPTPPEK